MKYRAITISLLSVIIFFLAISSYLLVSATNSAPTVIYLPSSAVESPALQDSSPKQEMESAKQGNSLISWEGKWSRNSQSSPGTLTITDETAAGFSFNLMSLSGVNVGELAGTATVHGERATGKLSEEFESEEEECTVWFTNKQNEIEIEKVTPSCYNWAGMGVDFTGKYKQGDAEPVQRTLVGSVFASADDDARFRVLVGEDYSLFTDNFMFISDEENLDHFGATVKAGYIRGLAPINYGIIMYDDTYIWAAVSHLPNENEIQLNYYSNHPDYRDKLPVTMENYVKGNYDTLILKSK
ncbi:hypothetical protein P9D43_27095 [Neobacillus niacini]|uniref:hypothetical protein n=1 Tax=Neobacillus niacini TaxID=86668 RepID=UPI0007AC205E|nr:hypothetical protein [Neobacillus niacini]MEC1525674.1 hypothetical protein [Neobacillus niacini]